MRTVLTSVFALSTLSLVSPRAHAQVVHLPEVEIDYSSSHADARYVADVGSGLAIAGISSLTLGTGLWFLPGGLAGYISGGTFWGLGGLLGIIGIPTWVAGGVRASITGQASDEARREDAHRWKFIGLGVFLASMGLATLGGALMLSAWGADYSTTRDLLAAGGVLIPIGIVVAMFIGAPMWGEGARF